MLRGFYYLIRSESFGGILLFLSTIVALLWANSVFFSGYTDFLDYKLGIHISDIFIGFTLQDWINDVLMSIFFFHVGLEIKREFLYGDLSGIQKASFPVVAAIGGMSVPAIIYLIINSGGDYIHGFGIPMATDIAFALGVASLLGSRIPASLKFFLATLAVVDDLGAIFVIAVFYANEIFWLYLFLSIIPIVFLLILHHFEFQKKSYYIGLGIILWLFIHASGIHATISAVILAFCIPSTRDADSTHSSMLDYFEHLIQPYNVYLIMPLFALANAGVVFLDFNFNPQVMSVFWGIAFGLIVGKPVGILLLCFFCDLFKIAKKPEDLLWRHIFGAGLLAGIGFAMSVFITHLAFDNSEIIGLAKAAILLASCLSAIIGVVMLFLINKLSKS